MKILVTGAAGFIGSKTVDELYDLGHEVISIDNESATSNEKFYWHKKVRGWKHNVCDAGAIDVFCIS